MGKRPYPIERDIERWRRTATRPDHIEQPGPGQESVWDYPRPPRIEPVARTVRIVHQDVALATTDRAIRVVETSNAPAIYLPQEDIEMAHVEVGEGESVCEWKGIARYWNVRVGSNVVQNAGWDYPDPYEPYDELLGYISFYASRLHACFVGDEQATPQPGEFYGGWVTSRITGPIKGVPGSEHW